MVTADLLPGAESVTLTGAVITTSTALTTIAFWFYDVFLPGPPHPYIGILIYLILPGIFVLGLLLIPIGIWLKRRALKQAGQLPSNLSRHRSQTARRAPHPGMGRRWRPVFNLLIVGTASYRGVEYMDSTSFCGTTCHTRDGSRIHGLSEFSALPRGLRRMPHRPGRRLVCALQSFRLAAGVRSHLSHLFASDSLAGKVSSSGAGNL